MKKLFLVLCSALFIVLGMSGCTSNKIDENGADAFDDAIQNLADLTSGTVDSKLIVDAGNAGITKLEFSGKFNTKHKLQASFNCIIASNGIKIGDLIHLYAQDDMLYVNVMDQIKVKTDIPKELTENPATDFASVDQFKLLTMKEENGKQTIHAEFKDVICAQATKDAKESTTKQNTEYSVNKIKSVTIDSTIGNDQTFDTFRLTMEVSYKHKKEAKPIDGKVTIDVKLTDKNKDLPIHLPDLKEYVPSTSNDSLYQYLDPSTQLHI